MAHRDDHGHGHGHRHLHGDRDVERDRHGNPVDLEAYLARIEDPDRLAWQRPDEVVAALALRPGDVACDVGVGPGYFALRIARAVGPAGRVHGVDVEPRMLELLARRAADAGLANVRPVLAREGELGLPPEPCAAILTVNTFHHFPDRPAALTQDPDGDLLNNLVEYAFGRAATTSDHAALAMPSVVMATFWRGFPFWFVSILAALQTIPDELYDAAKVDGASAWQRFRAVTEPGIRPIVIVTILLSSIWTANAFEHVWLLTQGGPSDATMVFPVLAYFGMQTQRLGEAAAVSLAMLPALAILVFTATSLMQRDEDR
jgi:SAM-dependent methyltransferase